MEVGSHAFGPRVIATFNEGRGGRASTRRLPQRRAWTLWLTRDGRIGVDTPGWAPFYTIPGEVLLSHPERRARLTLPPGAVARSVVFDVVDRPRIPAVFGMTPAKGSPVQPGPQALWGIDLPFVLPKAWGREAGRLIMDACDSWWRGQREEALVDLRLQAWFGAFVAARLQGILGTEHEATDPISRAEQYARSTFRSGCTVADMAERAGLSRARFTEAFTRARQVSPGRFLRTLRDDEARHLLTDTDMAIATIARRCGYRSAPTFARAFKQREGMEPSLWRRSRRG